MNNSEYVKQLEGRIELYEKIMGDFSNHPIDMLAVPNGDLKFLEHVCGFHSWSDGSTVISLCDGWESFYRVLRFER